MGIPTATFRFAGFTSGKSAYACPLALSTKRKMLMKKYIFSILHCLLLVTFLYSQKSYTGQTIEQIMELPEDEIDLGLACLIIAKEAYPNMNVAFFDYALDYMVNAIKYHNKGNQDPESRIALLNTYLFKAGEWNDFITFSFDYDDIEGNQKNNRYLNGLIASKKGTCITLPMLYMVLADRLGWPVYAVRAPQHVFCRYIVNKDSNEYYDIETTSKGVITEDLLYVKDFKIPGEGLKSGSYLRTLSKKEYLATMVHNHAWICITKEGIDLTNSKRLLQLGLKYDSTDCEAHWNIGTTYYFQAKYYEQLVRAGSDDFDRSKKKSEPWDVHPKRPSAFDYQNKVQGEREKRMHPSNPFRTPLKDNSSLIKENTTSQPKHSFGTQKQDFNQAVVAGRYESLIDSFYKKSEYHKNKARDLGMVFETTREFYLRQKSEKEKLEFKEHK